MSFGYHVSKAARLEEIRHADRRIAWFDLLCANAEALAPAYAGDHPDILELVLHSEATAAVFGLSREDAQDLADRYEYWPEWLGDFTARPGLWERAAEIISRMASRFGRFDVHELADVPSQWKADRAYYVRARSRARRAIADGRAS